MLKDISYRDYRRSSDIHGTVLYPAVMVAPVQNDILADLSKQETINRILDPFHGSGTLGVCCEKLNKLGNKIDWTGIELEDQWCNVAQERIEKI